MRTPVPRVSPVEYWVFCVLCAPTCRMFWYMRSWNAARPALKPVVLVFARLLAITAMRVFCASRPVLAAHNARFIECSFFPGSRGQHHAFGTLFVGVGRIDALDLKFVQALQLDHADQRLRRVDIAGFQHS